MDGTLERKCARVARRSCQLRADIGLSRDAIFVIGKIAARYEREGQRLRRRRVDLDLSLGNVGVHRQPGEVRSRDRKGAGQ